MNCYFRVDAAHAIGAGHVSRCLALATALRADGARVRFVSREHLGNLCERIESMGFELHRLAPEVGPEAGEGDPVHFPWLGADWRDDARATAQAIAEGGAPADWLVVDHYALDARWERELRKQARRILVIDDLADRQHDCDLLLDQNLVAQMGQRYVSRVPGSAKALLGPRYALLHPDYARLHPQARPRSGSPRRVLAFFGGTDPQHLFKRLIESLPMRNGPALEFDCVLPFGSGPCAAEAKGVRWHSGLESLAPLLAQVDAAIGTGGVTSWERLCLGVPSLVVVTAENQRPIAEELDRRGLVRYLGTHEQIDSVAIARALDWLAEQPLEAWSRNCLTAVDGCGAARVSAAMLIDPGSRLQSRAARVADDALLLDWANDAQARAQAFTPGHIEPETHARWLARRLDSPDCRLFIVESAAGAPLGQVRFERESDAWTISYSLDADFRGRGLGAPLLANALQALAMLEPSARVRGLVKPGNVASMRVFEVLGFALREHADALEYCRELRDFRPPHAHR